MVDVDNAFLNAPLAEEVYLLLPEGMGGTSGKVLRLRKALYGLKQSPRSWEKQLGAFLQSKQFTKCVSDSALFVCSKKKEGSTYVPMYVDDLMLVATTIPAMAAIKADLAGEYKLKELGEVSSYLGVQVTRNRAAKTISLGLPKYIT